MREKILYPILNVYANKMHEV